MNEVAKVVETETQAPPTQKAQVQAPAAAAPTAQPPAKERMSERLPEALAKAIKGAGYKMDDVLAVKSYAEQKLWRVVCSDGQRHEFGFDGQWLTKPKPKAKAEKAPKSETE